MIKLTRDFNSLLGCERTGKDNACDKIVACRTHARVVASCAFTPLHIVSSIEETVINVTNLYFSNV